MKMEEKILELFQRPKLVGVIGEVNSGKSNFLKYLFVKLKQKGATIVTFGFKGGLADIEIKSVHELEEIKNSIIFLDEFQTLIDLDQRRNKKSVEKTLRLIHHNNNIIVLCGLADNYKKFISERINVYFYKKTNLKSMINGSRAKRVLEDYHGDEMGSVMLNLDPKEVLLYDGKHYSLLKVPYLSNLDTKRENKSLIRLKGGDK